MKVMRSYFILPVCLLALLFIVACDQDNPQPTPVPATATPPGASATPTSSPTSTSTATNTATVTSTPTSTSTPTETPQPTFVSVPGPQPTTLVKKDLAEAKQKYDEALAKWNAQNVLEYDIVARNNSTAPFAGVWTLHVSGNQIDVLSFSKLDVITPTTPPDFMVGDALKFMTVEGLFASIDARLTSAAYGAALEARVDYLATFDPDLGYPISVEIRPKPTNKGQDLASSTKVEKLTIIKRATPVPVPPTPVPPPPDTAVPTSAATAIPVMTFTSTAAPTSLSTSTSVPNTGTPAAPVSTASPTP